MKPWPPRLIATAAIAFDGSIDRSVGIEAVTQLGTGSYQIEMTEEYQENSTLCVLASPASGTPAAWSMAEAAAPSNLLTINFEDTAGAALDTNFIVRVYKDA